jgi:hypothetical protein
VDETFDEVVVLHDDTLDVLANLSLSVEGVDESFGVGEESSLFVDNEYWDAVDDGAADVSGDTQSTAALSEKSVDVEESKSLENGDVDDVVIDIYDNVSLSGYIG